MNQFKDVFLGREKRDYTRAATSQKCMRVSGKHNDLDNVGPSLRHHTFFEMLGNFSFGDYFKHDAIELAWNLLTKEWGLDPSKLYVTVFKGEKGIPRDDEAYKRWLDFVPADHIGELGMADNFWAMGDTGPCGRCSEIYVDRGAGVPGTGNFIQDVESGSERFVEIWNNVFMEFERDDEGTLTPLPAPSIDTGMGLERISAVMQGTLSNYDTPLFMPLLEAIGTTVGPRLQQVDVADRRLDARRRRSRARDRRSSSPTASCRRTSGAATCCARSCGARCATAASSACTSRSSTRSSTCWSREMGDAYPELKAGRDAIAQVIKAEEERFDAVLTGGLPRLEEVLERAAKGNKVVPGDEAFKLYDTYGLPRDFIEDLAEQPGPALRRRGVRRGDGRPAREGARRQRLRRQEGRGVRVRVGRGSARRCSRPATCSRATPTTGAEGRAGAGAVRRQEEAGRCAEGRRVRLRGAVADAVLRRGRRPGVGPGLDRNRERRTLARRGRRAPRARPAARASARRRSSGAIAARDIVSVEVDASIAVMRRGAITRRRTCCTPRCARCSARTSSRRARSSRPIACASTSCTSPPSRRRSDSRSSGSSTKRS